MHIPDGYLSPQTSAVVGAAMLPVWATAARRVQRVVKTRSVPLIAIGSAFSFLIMMFNVPIPGGTSAHAVGGGLLAILLGPWAAVVAVSIALLIQALFFGDGGVLAYPANAFTMAVLMPFTAYAVYRLVARGSALTSRRRVLAAGLAGYAGINAAALGTAVALGVQPTLFSAADGTPLYSPYHLSQSIPAIMLTHITIAGAVEFAVTAGVVAYLQRANLPLLRLGAAGVVDTDAELGSRRVRPWRWAIVGMAVMVVLTPLGLLAPGGAFGEDSAADLDLGRYGLTAVPSGLARYNGWWRHTLLSDYGFGPGGHPVLGYLMSAVVGVLLVGLVAFGVGLLAARRRRTLERRAAAAGPAPVRLGSIPAGGSAGRTPAWLLQTGAAVLPCACSGHRRRGSVVDKTIVGGAGLLRQALFSEEVAARPGLLQRLDPRLKIFTVLALLVVTALVRHLPVLLAAYAATLALAAASRLPLRFFVQRVWLFIPIFTGVVVLPATLSVVSPGEVVIPLWHWHGSAAGLTAEGLRGAALIVTRVATSISLVVLLTLTTPWVRLLAALRAVAVPKIFVLVIGMAYRYLFLLLGTVTDMYTARKARLVGRADDVRSGRAFVAASAGVLFGKASGLSEEVHQAMVARGYRGEAVALDRFRLRGLDVGWLAAAIVASVLVLGGDRFLGR